MFELALLNDQQHRQIRLAAGAYWLGSKPTPQQGMPCIEVNDPWISQDQMIVHLTEDLTVTLQNMGRPILLPTGRRIKSQVETTLQLPCQFSIGKTRFSLHSGETTWCHDDTLATITRRLADHNAFTPMMDEKELNTRFLSSPPAADTLIHWFDALNELQRSSVGSQDFFQKAVHSVLDPGGLDLGLMLVKNQNEWEIAASHLPFPEGGISFRRDIVQRVIDEKRLWFHMGCEDVSTESAIIPHWIVAAPVFGSNDEVVAVLYGARFENEYNNRHGIRPLEAHFIRMVADSASSAMKRITVEAEAARSQVLLEQTFSHKVVEILKRDPKLLQSRETEVTVLFADMRNFSRLAESLGSNTTHQLLGDLFNQLTSIVESNQGVVIDFYGDGLAAFWNAPLPVEDHAMLACKTALQMHEKMQEINEQWSHAIDQPLAIGIGIHTGQAQVGNSGCHRKLKYGPRGNTVNLASRLESATKYYRVGTLISESTASRVQDRMMTLRLCRTRVPGIRQDLNVFQLVGQELSISKMKFGETYEAALSALEARDWESCIPLLIQLHNDHAQDSRVDFLLDQLENCLSEQPLAIDTQARLHTQIGPRQSFHRSHSKDDSNWQHYRAIVAEN